MKFWRGGKGRPFATYLVQIVDEPYRAIALKVSRISIPPSVKRVIKLAVEVGGWSGSVGTTEPPQATRGSDEDTLGRESLREMYYIWLKVAFEIPGIMASALCGSPLGRRGEKNESVSRQFESRKANVTLGGNPTTGLKPTVRPIVIQIFIFNLVLGFGPYLL